MPTRASTQSTLSILDIKDDVVIMTNGRYRVVLKVKAINFDLLSEDEQDAIIFAYASLINSLEFPIQIVVKTRQLNIASYLGYLDRFKEKQPNEALRTQLALYQEFIKKLVIENNVLFKTFYVIVPYDSIKINPSSFKDPINNLLGKKEAPAIYSAEEFAKAKEKLTQMRDEVVAQFQRIGLKTHQLANQELVELYYNLYNPEVEGQQQLRQNVEDYTTTMVHPAVG